MEIVHYEEDLARYMSEAVNVSNESPVLLDHFLDDAIEVDIDAICDGENFLIGGIMEHIEQAGIHSGDSACSLPPYGLSPMIQDRLRDKMQRLAKALNVVGLMNAQFAIKGETIYILEVNPRASRTVPFVSKATGLSLAQIAARCMAGKSLVKQGITKECIPSFYSVKEAVFPFVKFPGVDPLLGPEMKSTGEVMGIGRSFGEAFLKAQKAANMALPKAGRAFVSVRDEDKMGACDVARELVDLGFDVVATRGTAVALEEAKIPCQHVNKVHEGRPHIVDQIKNGEIAFIVNTTEDKHAIADSDTIRTNALRNKVTYTTTIAGARATVLALRAMQEGKTINCLQDLHQELHGENGA